MAEDLENLKLADDESLTKEMLEMLLDRYERGYTTEDVLLNKALEKFGLPVKVHGENIEYTRRGKGNLRVKVSPKAKGVSLQYSREFANGGPIAQGIAEADSKLSPAQALWVASLLDPTMATGASDVFAGLPSFPSADMTVAEMFAGPRDPNFIENLKQGNYGTAVLQSAGMVPGIGMLTRVQKIAKLQKIIRKAKHDEVRETAAIRVGEGDPAYRARQQAIDTGAAAEKELRRINLEQVDDVREAVPEGGIETLLKKKSAQQEFDF